MKRPIIEKSGSRTNSDQPSESWLNAEKDSQTGRHQLKLSVAEVGSAIMVGWVKTSFSEFVTHHRCNDIIDKPLHAICSNGGSALAELLALKLA